MWSHSAPSASFISPVRFVWINADPSVSMCQFPFQVGLVVAVTISSLVSLSRLYTGMHSILVKYSSHVHRHMAAF